MTGSLPYIADFDSASAMLRALARFLHGRDFPALGMSWPVQGIERATNLLPRLWRQHLYRFSGWVQATRPDALRGFRADALASGVTELYPRRRYPAIMVGSSNGALVHLCAALGMPWLPQTFLIPVHNRGADPDEPCEAIKAGARWAPMLLQANPELELHHMHDANQDRLMIAHMAYFRVKLRQLGRLYIEFIQERLEPGGTIFIADCRLRWPVKRVSRRHVFQHGAYGGADPCEYQCGGKRVSEFLRRQGSVKRRWVAPDPDEEAPEAEWGFSEALGAEIEAFGRRHGFRVVRIEFVQPGDPSPLVADLHRWWYARRGAGGQRLIVDSFILLDPFWALRLGAVPFWCAFAVEPSADALRRYLDSRPVFERIHIALFSHGVESIGLAPAGTWRALLARGRKPGTFLGASPDAFPADFAVFARYSPALRRLPGRLPMPEPLSLRDLDSFLDEAADRYAVEWRQTT
ncbi:MAG: hypothetical protein AB7H90_21900 [Alphaproteobacteria bacterium]